MIVDGKEIAASILSELQDDIQKLEKAPSLAVVIVGKNPVTQRFVNQKERLAESVGIKVVRHELPDNVSKDELERAIQEATQKSDGIVVQLPLPDHLDTTEILNMIPATHDVDVLSESALENFATTESMIFPPVAGAVREVLNRYDVRACDRDVVIVGKGRLVGEPTGLWFERIRARVAYIGKSDNLEEAVKYADIVLLGTGTPGLLKKEMVKDGVVVLDAGTSEQNRQLKGDADEAVADVASVFTPVPGGIGPITAAILLRNLVILASDCELRP